MCRIHHNLGLLQQLVLVEPNPLVDVLAIRFFLIFLRLLAFSIKKALLMISSLLAFFFKVDLGRPSKSLFGREMVSMS
jgi:hypothetical protein